jgi:hypothetical protein
MTKRKLHHLHKIKIHPNRWLFWAIAYILFVTIALVGYLKVSDLHLDAENSGDYSASLHKFTSKQMGFTLRYPADWSIEADNSSVNFLPSDFSDNGVSVSVLSPIAEKSLRSGLKILNEVSGTLDSTAAAKIRSDLGNGYTEKIVIATYNHKIYVIRGGENVVNKILLTFEFLE